MNAHVLWKDVASLGYTTAGEYFCILLILKSCNKVIFDCTIMSPSIGILTTNDMLALRARSR